MANDAGIRVRREKRDVMMECNEFLEGYSDYLDGLLSASERDRFEAHRENCEECARYDHVVQRGLQIFRELPAVSPSSDFLPRLKHRIYHIEDGIPTSPARHGGAAALVAVAAVGLLALAWLPVASSVPVEIQLPAVAVEAPRPAQPAEETLPSLFGSGPFVVPAARSTGGFPSGGAFLAGSGVVPQGTAVFPRVSEAGLQPGQ